MSDFDDLVSIEYESFRRSPDWELVNIQKALSMMPFLNGPREEARLEAVKRIRKFRREFRRTTVQDIPSPDEEVN